MKNSEHSASEKEEPDQTLEKENSDDSKRKNAEGETELTPKKLKTDESQSVQKEPEAEPEAEPEDVTSSA